MNRRAVLGYFVSLLAGPLAAFSRASQVSAEAAGNEIALPDALRALGVERIAIAGEQAFDEWRKIKAEGMKSPVIVGDDKDLENLFAYLGNGAPSDTPKTILARAEGLTHPGSLKARRAADKRQSLEWLAKNATANEEFAGIQIAGPDGKVREGAIDEIIKQLGAEDGALAPDVGEWPEGEVGSPGLTVVFNSNGSFKPKVHILLFPTADDCEVPAYLRWGGWNECPAPEYHVAALHSWKSRYGTKLVALNGDTMILIANRRPTDREAALALAREQFLYCEDIVLQGTETFAPLAAGLMSSEWWFFWWD